MSRIWVKVNSYEEYMFHQPSSSYYRQYVTQGQF